MPISGYFDVVFGVSGDLTAVPDGVQGDGSVSYTQGYGGDYELPVGNPARLDIERRKMNQLFNSVTSALQQYQQKGVPPFITTSMNGGSPFSYSQGDRVVSGGIIYTSLVNTNTTTPPGASWGTGAPVPLGGTGLTSTTAYAVLCGGTTSTASLQSIAGVGTSGQVLTSNGASALPTFQSISAAILAQVYPIGSYYFNETDSTNPATLFGFGTWAAVTDKFIVGHGSTYTATGGLATATLGSTNLPSFTITTPEGYDPAGTLSTSGAYGTGNVLVKNTATFSGSATPFSIIPPYQAAYIWKRTA